MPRLTITFSRLACAAALMSFLATVHADAVFSDSFDDGDVTKAGARDRFWSIMQPEANHDSWAFEKDGRLHLRAATWANTYVSLASPVLADFGFFVRPVTFTLDGIALAADGIPETDARFKLSVTATRDRAERALNAISLRIRPGLLLFGYRADGFGPMSSPETLSGGRVGSLVAEPLAGTPSKVSLTLGPSPTPGSVHYEIRAEGKGISFSRSGSFPLTPQQWGPSDAAAVVIDVRRDHNTELANTGAELSVDQFMVVR